MRDVDDITLPEGIAFEVQGFTQIFFYIAGMIISEVHELQAFVIWYSGSDEIQHGQPKSFPQIQGQVWRYEIEDVGNERSRSPLNRTGNSRENVGEGIFI